MSSPNPSANRMKTDLMKLMGSKHEVTVVDNVNELIVKFEGPPDTPYAGGTWKVRVDLPERYPFKSPSIGFANRIYHPNIDEISGTVCLDVINQTWSPMYDLINVFDTFLPQLLAYPNANDPLNGDAAAMYIHKPEEFKQKVREYVKRYASGSAIDENSTTRFMSHTGTTITTATTIERVDIPSTLGMLLQGENAHEFVRTVANAYLNAANSSIADGQISPISSHFHVYSDSRMSTAASSFLRRRHRVRRHHEESRHEISATTPGPQAGEGEEESSGDTVCTSGTHVTIGSGDLETLFGSAPPTMQIDPPSHTSSHHFTTQSPGTMLSASSLPFDRSVDRAFHLTGVGAGVGMILSERGFTSDSLWPASPVEEEMNVLPNESELLDEELLGCECTSPVAGSGDDKYTDVDDISLKRSAISGTCRSGDVTLHRERRWTYTSESDQVKLRESARTSDEESSVSLTGPTVVVVAARHRRRCVTLPSNPIITDESEMSDFDLR